VVDHALQPDRDRACEEWDGLFACTEGRCTIRGHYTDEQFEVYRSRLRANGPEDYSLDEPEDFEVMLADFFDEFSPEEKHHWNKQEWKQAVAQGYRWWKTQDSNFVQCSGDFDKYARVLAKDFGLTAWITHQNIPGTLRAILRFEEDVTEEYETTIAFLTLPKKHHQEDRSSFEPEGSRYGGEEAYICESTLSILVDHKALTINDEQRRRFARAMKILGLEPFVHPTQLISPGHNSFPDGEGKHSMGKVFLYEGYNKPHPEEKLEATRKERNRIEEHVKSEGVIELFIKVTLTLSAGLEKSSWPKLMSLVNTKHGW